jgi:hypothetical protein
MLTLSDMVAAGCAHVAHARLRRYAPIRVLLMIHALYFHAVHYLYYSLSLKT